MSFGLGLSSGFYMNTVNHFNNNAEITKWLDKIEKEFEFVHYNFVICNFYNRW